MIGILGFLSAMWALMLLGGAMAVVVLGPFSISGYGADLDRALTSAAKAAIAVSLTAAWVLALSAVKNRMFRNELRS